MTEVRTQSDVEQQSGSSKQTSISIKKAKLVGGVTLTYEAEEYENGCTNEITKKCGHPVHQDLRDALNRLDIHLACLCELIKTSYPFEDIRSLEGQLLEKITITGVSIGGEDEHAGATIIGSRALRGGKVLNLVAPFTKFEEESSEPYPYLPEFYNDVQEFLNEVDQYIAGKYGEGAQLSMFDNADDEI